MKQCDKTTSYKVTVAVTNLDNSASGSWVWWTVCSNGVGLTVDYDYANFGTNYRVEMTVTDASGNVVDSRTATTVTPLPKTGTTAG